MAPPPATTAASLHVSFSRRKLLMAGAGAALGFGAYAAFPAAHDLQIVRRTLPLRNLPAAFEGLRIAQLSDIHLDEYTEPSFVREVVRRTNELAPDLVVLTGDYISRGPRSHHFAREKADECAELLAGLTCRTRISVLGNHDASVDADHVTNMLRERSLIVLRDAYVPVERRGERIWLSGANEPGVLGCDLDSAIPAQADGPVIFLAHEPDFADVLTQSQRFSNVDVMLSGHSHGGQVRLPWVGPLVLPPLGVRYVQGAFQIGHMQLYVNRGIGTVGLPFRLNCPPEITEFTLTHAESTREGRGSS